MLSPNRSGIAEFVGLPSILETRRQVEIAFWEAKLYTIYSDSVVKLSTNLYFVLIKYTASLEIVNTESQIDFWLISSEV